MIIGLKLSIISYNKKIKLGLILEVENNQLNDQAYDAESIKVLKQLKDKNYKCYVLSNWSAETFEGIPIDYPFMQLFDGLLISGEDKLIKPDQAIYELAKKRFNLDPEETVFIDDKLENIEAAQKMNFKTIHLTNPKNIEMEIKKFLV
mgnify:CR=1 FL=1